MRGVIALAAAVLLAGALARAQDAAVPAAVPAPAAPPAVSITDAPARVEEVRGTLARIEAKAAPVASAAAIEDQMPEVTASVASRVMRDRDYLGGDVDLGQLTASRLRWTDCGSARATDCVPPRRLRSCSSGSTRRSATSREPATISARGAAPCSPCATAWRSSAPPSPRCRRSSSSVASSCSAACWCATSRRSGAPGGDRTNRSPCGFGRRSGANAKICWSSRPVGSGERPTPWARWSR